MSEGSIVAIHSTVHPATCLRLQQDYPTLHIIDAPVSGGGFKAADGTLLVMVGGADDAVALARPVFETFGEPVLHVGPLGAGQEVKLLNNLVFTAQLALASEAFALAARRDLDLAAVAAILAGGSGRSYAVDVVGGMGFDLDDLATVAGELLAKDVSILVEHIALSDSPLLDAADAALAQMAVARGARR